MESLKVNHRYYINKDTFEITRKDDGYTVSRYLRANGYEVHLGYYHPTGLQFHSHYLSRLIAIQWIPNPHNWKYVKHKDGDRKNNSIDNLYWAQNRRQTYTQATDTSKNLSDIADYERLKKEAYDLREIVFDGYNYDLKSEPYMLLGLLKFLNVEKIRNIYGMCEETFVQTKQKRFKKPMIRAHAYHWNRFLSHINTKKI
jgi:hypothetical protein